MLILYRDDGLRNIGGSQSDHWNNILANQTVETLWVKNSDKNERDRQVSAAVAAIIGIAPKHELFCGQGNDPRVAIS